MNLYLRLILVVIKSFFRPRLKDIFTGGALIFRVLPNDLDTNLHMNNGRYLTIMDLGRLDLVIRTGLGRVMMKQGAIPVLSAVKMRYRIPLSPFQKYRLNTQVICWDDKWVYMKQTFTIWNGDKTGVVAAIALLKGGFYNRRARRTVPTNELLKILGLKEDSPEFPSYILKWQEAEMAVKKITAEQDAHS